MPSYSSSEIKQIEYYVELENGKKQLVLRREDDSFVEVDVSFDQDLSGFVRRSQINVESVAYDEFVRSDRAVDGDISASGQGWSSAGAGAIVSNRLSGSMPGQPSYNQLNLGAPMRAMACQFILEAGTGDNGLALINGAIPGFSPLGNNWIHLAVTPAGWFLTWTTNAVVNGPITFTEIDSVLFDTRLLKDGTVYGISMEIIGNRAFITVWNVVTGIIVSQRITPADSRFVSFLGSHCTWEPIPPSGAFGGSAIVNVSATTQVSALESPSVTRGDVVNLVAEGVGNAFALGYGTNLPPWAVSGVPFGVAGANYGWISRLISDGVPNATKIRLYVGASSGNICAGVYRMQSGGVVKRIATTGTIPCPAVGSVDLALLSPVTAFRATDFLALAIDNTIATFYGANAPLILMGDHGIGLMTNAVPLPAGPIGALWGASGPTVHMILTA